MEDNWYFIWDMGMAIMVLIGYCFYKLSKKIDKMKVESERDK